MRVARGRKLLVGDGISRVAYRWTRSQKRGRGNVKGRRAPKGNKCVKERIWNLKKTRKSQGYEEWKKNKEHGKHGNT